MGMRKFRWNDETVMSAVERFRLEKGDYSRQHDFQYTDYLPDPETIRRLYGGLPQFREKFGFPVQDYTKGKIRGDLGIIINNRAKSHEDKIHKYLIDNFGEVCVHKEREFSYRNRVDFQVYHADGIFGVDTFYPKNKAGLANNFNLKHVKYKNYTIGPIYLVNMNSDLTQEILNEYMKNKINFVESNIKLFTSDEFKRAISVYRRRTQL